MANPAPNPTTVTRIRKPKAVLSPIQVAAKIEQLLKPLTDEQRKMVLGIIQ